jgi:hypothetical protein
VHCAPSPASAESLSANAATKAIVTSRVPYNVALSFMGSPSHVLLVPSLTLSCAHARYTGVDAIVKVGLSGGRSRYGVCGVVPEMQGMPESLFDNQS